NLTPLAILLTHAHFDHIGEVQEIRTYYNIDVYLHDVEKTWLENPELNRSVLFLGEENAYQIDALDCIIEVGELVTVDYKMEVVHTPGHSPGSVTVIFEDDELIVSGDVLFQRGIGRTDLPGGDMQQLAHSIVTKLYVLNELFIVYPGHGSATKIKDEKELNPFTLQFYNS